MPAEEFSGKKEERLPLTIAKQKKSDEFEKGAGMTAPQLDDLNSVRLMGPGRKKEDCEKKNQISKRLDLNRAGPRR
jgi:hypothetical protein